MEKPAPPSTDNIAQLLICPIHLKLFEDPVLCVCGHTFCRACITNVINTSGHCPFDGKELTLAGIFPNKIIAAEVASFVKNGGVARPASCTYIDYGCTWKGPSEALSTHLTSCDYEKMKDFILKKEQEAAQLRTDVSRKDEQIAQLQRLLAEGGGLQAELNRILSMAMNLALQGKTAIQKGFGAIAGEVADGWQHLTDDKTYKQLSLSLEQTAEQCAASIKNVLGRIQLASHRVTDSEFLGKLLVQTATWKDALAKRLEEIGALFAQVTRVPFDETQEQRELREATRESLQSYLQEVHKENASYEKEQSDLVQGVLNSVAPPVDMPPPPAPPAADSASTSSGSATSSSSSVASDSDLQMTDPALEGFTPLEARPLPPIHSSRLAGGN